MNGRSNGSNSSNSSNSSSNNNNNSELLQRLADLAFSPNWADGYIVCDAALSSASSSSSSSSSSTAPAPSPPSSTDKPAVAGNQKSEDSKRREQSSEQSEQQSQSRQTNNTNNNNNNNNSNTNTNNSNSNNSTVEEGKQKWPQVNTLPIVRAILAAASPKLEKLWREAGTKEITVPLNKEALEVAVRFCLGSPPDSSNMICSLAELERAAEFLDLDNLKTWCRQAAQGPHDSPLGNSGNLEKFGKNASGTMTNRWLLGASLLLLVGAAWAWSPCCWYLMDNNGFFMDDRMISKNDNVIEDFDLDRLLRTDYWGLEMFNGTWTHKSFRPATVLTFRWNYLLHGFESSGFHITNLVLHFVASALLGLVAHCTLDIPRAPSLLLTSLFFCHPVHSENVLYIVGRADILCQGLLLLATLLYSPCLSTRTAKAPLASLRLIFASLLLVVAGLCKETGFCFFGLLAGWEILGYLVRSLKAKVATISRLLLLLILGSLACGWRLNYTAGTSIERMDPHSNSIAGEPEKIVRVLSYSLLHGIYGQLLIWPTFLCYDYSFDAIPLVRSCTDVRLLLPLAIYLGFFQLLVKSLAILGCRDTRIKEAPIVGLAILVLSFIPMSNILFPVGTMIGERLLYVPSAGLLLTIVGLAVQSERSFKRGGPLLVALGIFFLALLAIRVPEWASPEAITVADGQKQLRSGRVQYNYANVHLAAKRYEEALAIYQRAIDIDPLDRDSLPLFHAGQILIYQSKPKEALNYLSRAVSGFFSPLTMAEEEIWHDYALAHWFNQDAEQAVQNFWNALTINPAHTKSLNNLGCAHGLGAITGALPQHHARLGVEMIQKALSIDQGNILYWRNLVTLLRIAGDASSAALAWQELGMIAPAATEGPPPEDCTWEFSFR